MFQNKVATGQTSGATKLETKHQNYINCIKGYQGAPGAWKKISTSALDGRVVIWDI
jgi:actin related protein 2/3 complex, subunit 1A/1B